MVDADTSSNHLDRSLRHEYSITIMVIITTIIINNIIIIIITIITNIYLLFQESTLQTLHSTRLRALEMFLRS